MPRDRHTVPWSVLQKPFATSQTRLSKLLCSDVLTSHTGSNQGSAVYTLLPTPGPVIALHRYEATAVFISVFFNSEMGPSCRSVSLFGSVRQLLAQVAVRPPSLSAGSSGFEVALMRPRAYSNVKRLQTLALYPLLCISYRVVLFRSVRDE